MSAEAFATINGFPLAGWSLHVPHRGAWFIDADQEDDSGTIAPGDSCVFQVGALHLLCTAAPNATGTRALQRKLRLVAGAGNWGGMLKGLGYHNDAGIKALTVARDAAAFAGETLGAFKPERAVLGVDFVRVAGPASRALEQAIGSVPWYVDYSGITQVQTRPSSVADPSTYEVQEYNSRTHIADLYIDDLSGIGVGSVISANLDTQETIQSFDVYQQDDKLRMIANCAVTPDSTTQLETAFRRAVERVVDSRLRGPYRYFVASMNSDGRVNLKSASARSGAPQDLLLIEQWPGVAGADAVLTPGAQVIVEFADDGDPSQPIITHFRGKQDAGFIPVSLALLGGKRSNAAQGDLVQSGGPGTVVTLIPLTGAGAPPNNAVVAGVPHLISFSSTPPTGATADPLYGAISTGDAKLKVP